MILQDCQSGCEHHTAHLRTHDIQSVSSHFAHEPPTIIYNLQTPRLSSIICFTSNHKSQLMLSFLLVLHMSRLYVMIQCHSWSLGPPDSQAMEHGAPIEGCRIAVLFCQNLSIKRQRFKNKKVDRERLAISFSYRSKCLQLLDIDYLQFYLWTVLNCDSCAVAAFTPRL